MSIFNDFDQIVTGEFKKSVVVAPSDPNGGGKLPDRQENKEKGKKKEGQHEAIFDRKYKESNNQLDDWMKDTNETTGSPEKFVNEDDDETWAEDPDNEEDGRGADYYDALSDDEPKESVKVRKSNKTEEEEEEKEEVEEEKEEKKEHKPEKADKAEKEKDRKKEVRKSMGADAANFVDASPFAKALVDAIMDWREDVVTETRALNTRINQLEKALRSENRQMTKSLASGMAQLKPPAGTIDPEALVHLQAFQQPNGIPVRKSYGMDTITTQKFQEPWDFAKALDVLDNAIEKGIPGILSTDVINLEISHSPQNLSPAAKRYLLKEKCIPQNMF